MIVETLWPRSMPSNARGPDRESAVVAEEAVDLLTSYDRRAATTKLKVRDQQPLESALVLDLFST